MRYTIQTLEMTCDACPSQWEGTTIKGRKIYIRYRWGYLRVDIDGKTIYMKSHGDGLDGMMDTDDMLKHVKSFLRYPVDRR